MSCLRRFIEAESIEYNKRNKRWGMTFVYDDPTDVLYAYTKIGCWKIFWDDKAKRLRLYHMNKYDGVVSLQTMLEGEYHHQRSLKHTDSVEEVLSYIIKHDNYKDLTKKECQQKDLKRMPKGTKRKKKKYVKAKTKFQNAQLNRVDEVFKVLEEETPALLEHANSDIHNHSFKPLQQKKP